MEIEIAKIQARMMMLKENEDLRELWKFLRKVGREAKVHQNGNFKETSKFKRKQSRSKTEVLKES